MALRVGQAEQGVHRRGILAVQDNTRPPVPRKGRLSGPLINHLQADLSPLLLHGGVEDPLQPCRWIHHRHVQGVAGESKAGDRCAVGVGAIRRIPIGRPPELTRFLPHHQLNRRRGGAGGAAGAALAEGHHGELLDLGNAEVGIALPHDLQ